ncbi:MAG: lysophospholipase [Desulfobacterales bacterium]|jgi:pimeloyl-ACP methyl ester carboxylesterase|nr:lysophospholipase [Desulfobacterales bacterium]
MKQRSISVVLLFAAWVCSGLPSAHGAFQCGPDGRQQSGSIYRICMPVDVPYNGRLVLWAHGFQDAGTPVLIPEDQLGFGDVSIPGIVTGLGFGFATNSYSKTGLAVEQGSRDLVDLVNIFTAAHGEPMRIFLVGASEGGLITALLVESHPDLFDAGLAACGPVGDFPYQIRYLGDARATFQYFFPGLIPGDPFKPDPALAARWTDYYKAEVKPKVFAPANRSRLDQWARVAKLPYDEKEYLRSLESAVADVLRYAVVNLGDAAETLGGFPFENRWTWYHGSKNDIALNLSVPRRAASAAAVSRMKQFYNTTGRLDAPLITLHTLKDPLVPYHHEFLYNLKTLASGSFLTEHLNIPVARFGHCNFKPEEALLGFGLMLLYAGELHTLAGIGSVLQGEGLSAFEAYARQYGLPFDTGGDRLRLK